MGCHSSKQAQQDLLHSPSPLRRSKSLADGNGHVVSLTSSTLGSLDTAPKQSMAHEDAAGKDPAANARAWIPRTPTETPPCEPESVDAWEVMAGLHGDSSPLDRSSFSFSFSSSCPPTAVIFYFTSLRVVRKTYEACLSVRAMLREHGVRVDERDVSMHARFKEEASGDGATWQLPRVVVGGRDLGGEEEVRRMHEGGELGRLLELEGCRQAGGQQHECKACGDIRFVPCARCSGSCRLYVEDEEEDGDARGWRQCSQCNENGIVSCPVCCSRMET